MRRQTQGFAAIRALCVMSLFGFMLVGCEDVIQVELRQLDPKIVIEGYVENGYFSSMIIRNTTDIYDPNFGDRVSGAIVIVSSAYSVDTLEEVSEGEYFGIYFDGVPGDSLFASVRIGSQFYTAVSTVPQPIKLDSMRLVYQEGGGFGIEEEEGYRPHLYFKDNEGSRDYARIKLLRDGVGTGGYYIYDDKFSDGKDIEYDYFHDTFQPGDFVVAELRAMDEAMFDYFSTLSDVVLRNSGEDAFDIAPSNPISNWSGGAIGYFGVFVVSSQYEFLYIEGE